MSDIYFSTVLLDKNRWGSREPSLKVSDWLPAIADGGFDGLELWENHLLKADDDEKNLILSGPLPVRVLNTYCDFDAGSSADREKSARLARDLNVSGVKFNFGNKIECVEEYRENLIKWQKNLPAGCRLLCECHPYTVLEDMEKAAEILQPLLDRVEIIIHAFGSVGSDWKRRLELFGKRITHIHVAGGGEEGYRYSPLASSGKIEEGLSMLEGSGIEPTWTIEFCDGVASKGEVVEDLLNNAIADAKTLRKKLSC